MHRWDRPPQPKELSTHKAALTLAFVENCERTGTTASCKWPMLQLKGGGEERLHDYMARSTEQHCSYCDSMMNYAARETIDHFLPKSVQEFRKLAYEWKNLYLACDSCQAEKSVRFDKTALRPDAKDYEFARYFRFHRDGSIEVIADNAGDRRRANATVKLFKLDNPKLNGWRKRVFEGRLKPRTHKHCDDGSYRDFPGALA